MIGDGIRNALTVTGEAATLSEDEALAQAAEGLPALRAEPDRRADGADDRVRRRGEGRRHRRSAKALFPVARTYWERIEPVAEIFGDLDPRIDGREGDQEEGQDFTGFHRIEKALWETGDISDMGPYADQLLSRRRGDRGAGRRDHARPAAARQRREGAARRGRHRQDHRRGGPLLAHRPVGLRRQRRGLAGRRPGAAALPRGAPTPTWSPRSTSGSPTTEAELEQYRSGDGWTLHDQLTEDQLQGLSDSITALTESVSPGRGGRRGPMSANEPQDRPAGLSRRRLFGLVGAGTAGVLAAGAAGGVIGHAVAEDGADRSGARRRRPVHRPAPGRDRHAGAGPAALRRLRRHHRQTATDLVEMLQAWTAAARRMTAGQDAGPVGAVDGSQYAPPDDTGEAIGLPAAGLTLTIGFGPGAVHDRRRHRPLRAGRAPPGAAGGAARVRRRPDRPGDQRRGPLHPGLRQRSAGRGARRPQPGPARGRRGQRPLVAARASAAPPRRAPTRSRRATCSASRTARTTSRPRTPQALRPLRLGRATATAAPTGWPAGPTWSPGGSGC